jgi:hypothetical protein
MGGVIKIGTCLKCGEPVYCDNIHGSPDRCNILLQNCPKGGDCEVDILKTPLAKRNRFAD